MSIEIIQTRLLSYQCQTIADQEHALKEIAQEIALMALSRVGFFRVAAFQGGTCLRILYGLERFSEDLDFSVIDAPKGEDLEQCLNDTLQISKELLNNYGPFDIQLKRYPERAPHPKGQDAFNVLVKFPWHSESSSCRIKLEITHDEPVLLPPEYRSILHDYEEQIDCKVASYQIEEILAEKLRALLQTHQKLIIRGWNRPRARDYYDLWCILNKYYTDVNRSRLVEILDKKCAHRNVSYQNVDDFFTLELNKETHQHWQATLGTLVPELPECEKVLSETRKLVEKILS